jgi:hypothetical protein
MGIGVGMRGSDRIISHGGGINGYLSDLEYFPGKDLTIVVLQNSTGPVGPDALGDALAGLILGPVPVPTAVPFTGNADAFVGEYAGPARGTHLHMTITRDGTQLVFTAAGRPTGNRPVHVGGNEWVNGGTRYRFVVADGKALELRVMQGAGVYVLRRIR